MVFRKMETTNQRPDEFLRPTELSFLRAYCESQFALIKNQAQAKLVWDSFMGFALHWLVNERNDLDLGFAKLHSFPLRKNWTDVLKKKRASNLAASLQCQFTEGTELTSFDPTYDVVRWELFVSTSVKYLIATMDHEVKARGRNKQWYALRSRKLLNTYAYRIQEYLTAYLAEADYPTCRIPKKFRCTQTDWKEYWRQLGSTPPPPVNGHQNGHAAVSGVLEQGAAKVVAGEDETLLDLSDIQSDDQNVWDAWRDMAEYKEPKSRAARVPVLLANKKRIARRLLAEKLRKREAAKRALARAAKLVSAGVYEI